MAEIYRKSVSNADWNWCSDIYYRCDTEWIVIFQVRILCRHDDVITHFFVDWGPQRNWCQHMVCCLHHFSRLLDWFQWQLVSMFITMLNNNTLIGWLLLEQWRFSLVELLVISVSSTYASAVIKVQLRSSNGEIKLSVFSVKYHILYFVTWISCVVSCLHWNGNIWWQFAILHHFPTW